MTTEEKAKAYEMALEAARKELGVDRKEWKVVQQVLHNIFPELAESEDERIRKWLYDYISNCPNNNFSFYGGVGKDAVLNYLEKQKEQKHPNGCFTCDEYKKGYEEGRRNGFTAGYNKTMKEVEQKEQKPWKVGANAYFTPEQKPELVQRPPITYTYPSDASRDEQLKRAIIALLNSDLIKVAGNKFTKQDLIDWVEKQKPAECGCVNDESEYDKGYREGHRFGLKQTQEYMLHGGKTFSGLIPCWVNAPSELQPAHKYHGKNVVVMHENNGGFRCVCIDDEKPVTFHLPEDTLFVEGWRKKSAEWKPLPESMEALLLAIEGKWDAIKPTGYMSRRLEDLYDGLVNTFDVDEKYLGNLPKTEYTEKDIEEIKALKEKIESSMETKPAERNANYKAFIKDCARILDENGYEASAERLLSMSPVKPVEWSEEDENYLGVIVRLVEQVSGWPERAIIEYTNWLKSLRPQPQGIYQQVVKGLRDMCDRYEQNGMFTDERARDFLGNVRVKCKDAIESVTILDEPSWRPSEEQMEALYEAAQDAAIDREGGNALYELYENLKRL